MGKIFGKAGEHWAKLLIPGYGQYLKFRVADSTDAFFISLVFLGISLFFTLLYLVFSLISPVLYFIVTGIAMLFQIVVMFTLYNNLAYAFRKSPAFFAGLFLFPAVFLLILGFDSSVYNGEGGGQKFLAPELAWICPECGKENPVYHICCCGCGVTRKKEASKEIMQEC